MGYALENDSESKRLLSQEKIKMYQLSNDLSDFNVASTDTLLDAGCGTGIISLFLEKNFKPKQIDACDFSNIRLKQAENFLKENLVSKVQFFTCNLEEIPKNDNSYDKVVCRFVYEYLPNPKKVTEEFYRVCKQGGKVRLIDLDGVVFNIHTNNKQLTSWLEQLKIEAYKRFNLDFFAGRKLFTHMKEAGFKNVSYQIRPMSFQGEDLEREIENYKERFHFGRDILNGVFGEKTAAEFIDLYLKELKNPNNIVFYNNFIVTGEK